jgi:hypothetical protein
MPHKVTTLSNEKDFSIFDAAGYAIGVEAHLKLKDKDHSFDDIEEYFLCSWKTNRITNLGTRILRSKIKPLLKDILELDAS